MSSENHLLKKTVQLVKYLGTAIPDAECDEEAILAVYVHLQQAASVLMDQVGFLLSNSVLGGVINGFEISKQVLSLDFTTQQIRHETKTKGEESKTGSSPKIQFGIPPKVLLLPVNVSLMVCCTEVVVSGDLPPRISIPACFSKGKDP
eukprot:760969-Amorphochlora_amoeboformis.AAC.1